MIRYYQNMDSPFGLVVITHDFVLLKLRIDVENNAPIGCLGFLEFFNECFLIFSNPLFCSTLCSTSHSPLSERIWHRFSQEILEAYGSFRTDIKSHVGQFVKIPDMTLSSFNRQII